MAMVEIGRIRLRMMGAHSTAATYEVLDMVTNDSLTTAYMAVRDVPAGIPLSNQSYWRVILDASTIEGKPGPKGEQGMYFIPQLDDDYYLSFTSSEPVSEEEGPLVIHTGKSLMGPPGPGIIVKGTYASIDELRTNVTAPEIGDAYTIENDLYVWTVTGWINVGTIRGKDGKDGYAPVRGTDYWTEDDIAAIKSYVDEAILGGEW